MSNGGLIYIYVAIMALFLLFAIISNVLVIVSVARFKKLRSVTNVLICNLAVSDILLAGLYMPQKLHDISHSQDYYEGEIVCKLINSIPIFLITSSCYTLVCVSFERHRAITNSNKSQMTLIQILKVIPLIWIFSFLVSLPTIFEYTTHVFYIFIERSNTTETRLYCGNNKMSNNFILSNGVFVLIVSFLIPLVLVFTNYIRLAKFINQRGRQIFIDSNKVTTLSEQVQTRPVSILHRNRLKLVKMLILVAVMFAISWIPFFVLYMYMKITGKDASKDVGSDVSLLIIAMATFSTAYNVVLYVIFNNNFKEAFKNILKCSWTQLPGSRSNP